MSMVSILKKELKAAIRESVREVLTEELMNMRAILLPRVSRSEQKEIEKRYGKPIRKVARSMNISL